MTNPVKKATNKKQPVEQSIVGQAVEQENCTPEKLVEILTTTENEDAYVFSKRGLMDNMTRQEVFDTVVIAIESMKTEVVWFEKVLEALTTDQEYAANTTNGLFNVYTLERERLNQFLEAYDAPIPNATHEE
jgi:hypothetical protein